MIKKNIKEEISRAQYEMDLNLENNYRELAYKNFLEYVSIIKKYKDEGAFKAKDLEKLENKVSQYKERFESQEDIEEERGKMD